MAAGSRSSPNQASRKHLCVKTRHICQLSGLSHLFCDRRDGRETIAIKAPRPDLSSGYSQGQTRDYAGPQV
ncbi:hypothetical protein MCOR25_010246 [Pyricularia grisea]|uniref:Uncharacterized protein n=1 Tax=Pyricularia grisea TaxID=148305 RepID=A0A6P8AQV7_PYRGI|nr:uncharacterized protein PgNI_11981 [Pyricularia grisea]KAI6350962.1 hypothetical protein MCOR25_010246 [Pyricularia grisea]TLD04434.1 hypothetical protein PgNI_11981 [Pyricularia grisea]